jgi:cytochrome c oxidase cbb3-type subunit 3
VSGVRGIGLATVTSSIRWRVALAFALGFSAIPLFAQASRSTLGHSSRSGQQVFASNCAGCHGLDGRGGERAPNIAANPKLQRMSDEQVFRIVSEGVAGTGMPAFDSLTEAERRAVVKHLRSLQGRGQTGTLPGNPATGKTVFFGKGECSRCHMAAGQGGFLASDLTAFAKTKSPKEISQAITDPVSDGHPRTGGVVVTLRDGRRFEGILRNQDNFSLQIQTSDGSFRFLQRADVLNVERDPKPLMPQNYADRLSRSELDDLVSYLMSVAESRKAAPAIKEEE